MPPTLKPAAAAHSTLAQLIGQKLIVRMQGLTPSADLLGRIRRGEVGGVILFGANITTPAALVQLIGDAAGGRGGRGPAAAPDRGRPGGRADQAHPVGAADAVAAPDGRDRQHVGRPDPGRGAPGRRSGRSGIDVDLAPVADVPASTSSFMYQAGRTFSFSATTTARAVATRSPAGSSRRGSRRR